ncbi:unnamed protein product, partial [Symbiodinium sp. KB8]
MSQVDTQVDMKAMQKKWIKAWDDMAVLLLQRPQDIISDRGGIISKLRETKSFLNDPSSSSEKGIVANFDVLAVFIDCPAENLSRKAGGIVRVRRLDCIEYVLCQCLRHARVKIVDGALRKQAKAICRLLTYHKRMAERSKEQRHPIVQRLTVLLEKTSFFTRRAEHLPEADDDELLDAASRRHDDGQGEQVVQQHKADDDVVGEQI